MMNDPSDEALQRLLAEEAKRAIPADIDLWSGIAGRLTTPGTFRAGTPAWRHEERGQAPRPDGQRRAPGELVGNAMSFALGALAIAVIAIIIVLPSRDGAEPGNGVGTPEAGHLPPTLPTAADNEQVHCTVELDVAPEVEADRVAIPARARVSGQCGDVSDLQLAIVDTAGKPLGIDGNPQSVPLAPSRKAREVRAIVIWDNWCADRGRFRMETRLSNERHLLPLPEAPPCTDPSQPSRLRLANLSPPSASPTAMATPSTPFPSPDIP